MVPACHLTLVLRLPFVPSPLRSDDDRDVPGRGEDLAAAHLQQEGPDRVRRRGAGRDPQGGLSPLSR